MKKMRNFLKKEAFKTRDIAIDPVSAAATGTALGLSLFSWVLITLVAAGMVFAIVKIVQISKKKKTAQA
ncbi:MAG: hypothetical protein J6P73_01235 [Bacteroidales bacterium]|nr:hypothetical protein [Bacteroidales bacterium]